jgi:2-phosphoglycerate kinase
MSKPYVVIFSGVPGSSKSIISNYLSYKFNLPILNNDQIRWEVCEDYLIDSIHISGAKEEFHRRFKARREDAFAQGTP